MALADHFDKAFDAAFTGSVQAARTSQSVVRAGSVEPDSAYSGSPSPTGSVNPRRRMNVTALNIDAPPGEETSEEKRPVKPAVPIGVVVKQLSGLIKILLVTATCITILVSVLLILTLIEFYASADKTRLEYLKYGTAPRLAAKTTLETFNGLLVTRSSFITALDTLTYTDEFDYSSVELIVAPLFSEFPELYGIDLSFSDSDYGIYISRYPVAANVDSQILMRSDSESCHSISNHACVLHTDPDHSTHQLDWYKQFQSAVALDDTVTSLWSGPDALIESASSFQESLAIKTGISLIFSHPFKFRTTKLICKVTTATSTLRSVLGDDVLLSNGAGRLFIVNSEGRIVAGSGMSSGEYISLSPQPSGSGLRGNEIVYKFLYELGGPLAAYKDVDFKANSISETSLPARKVGILYPFDQNYLRLVAVSESTPFLNTRVQALIVVGIIASGLPYLVGIALVIVFGLKQRAAHNRMIERERDMAEAQLALTNAKARGDLAGALATGAPSNLGRRRR